MATIIKKFLEWLTVKEKLHNSNAEPPIVKERDLWWVSFGENVGSEINGKSKLFSRPGIVIKKTISRILSGRANNFAEKRRVLVC